MLLHYIFVYMLHDLVHLLSSITSILSISVVMINNVIFFWYMLYNLHPLGHLLTDPIYAIIFLNML